MNHSSEKTAVPGGWPVLCVILNVMVPQSSSSIAGVFEVILMIKSNSLDTKTQTKNPALEKRQGQATRRTRTGTDRDR